MPDIGAILWTVAKIPPVLHSPWWALIAAAFVASWVPVVAFRLAGNPESLRMARSQLLARALELVLFRHDGRVLMTATYRIGIANLSYLRQFAAPMLVGALPLILLWSEGAAWFQYRAFVDGETIIVELQLAPNFPVMTTPIVVQTLDGVGDVIGPVRTVARNELTFRLQALGAKPGRVGLRIGDVEYLQPIAIGDELVRLVPARQAVRSLDQLLEPIAPLLPPGPVVSCSIRYPARLFQIGGWELSAATAGIVLLLGFSIVVGKCVGVNVA